MSEPQQATHSLRRRLLLGILVPVVLFIVLDTFSLYRQALAAVTTHTDTTMVLADYFAVPSPRFVLDVRPERILYGTDWPFYHQAIGIAKVLMATEGDDRLRDRKSVV